MSNFSKFNHKPLINPAYQDSEQYIPLTDIPFKKPAALYTNFPEMVYSIRAMYRNSSDYGDQIIAIVKPEYAPGSENEVLAAMQLALDGVFRMALPHKYVEIINVDDPALISDCNNGLARFRITQYHSKRFNKDLNGIEFV
jgi:hypothetical protein